MSVATKNPFALLDADDASADAPPPAKSAPAPPAPAARDAPKKTGPASRGGRYYPRGGAKPPPARDSAGAEDPAEGTQRKFDGGDARGRGRGRGGRGGDRGGRGGGGGGRGRTYDRHSMTGRTDTDKRVHQSWGGDDGNTELRNEVAATNDAAAEAGWGGGADAAADAWGGAAPAADEDAWGAAPAGDAPAPAAGERPGDGERGPRREREPREPEEDDNTLTLEQYLAQKKASEAIPKLEGARKANEGADDWKDVVPLKKPDEDEDAYFVGKGKTAPKARTEKKEKVFLEIDARFERPARGGRGRGERGGERPPRATGRARGAPRGRGASAPVNVDDEKAFPSLS